MSQKLRAGIFVGMAAVTVFLCHLFPNAATNPEAGLVMWLPEETSFLRGTSMPISKIEADTLPLDTTYLKMAYQEKHLPDHIAQYRQMSVTLILSGADRRSLHEPEVCLDGQGWDLEKRTVIPINIGGKVLEVMDLQLGRWIRREDGSLVRDEKGKKIRYRAHYIYWWVARDDSTPHSKERIIRTALNNMFRNVNDRWGYPSILVPLDPRIPLEEGHAEAKKRAIDFITEFAPKFQKSLGAKELEGEQENTRTEQKVGS